MITREFIVECAVAAFRQDRETTKLNKFKAFVESLRDGADSASVTAINALLEGTNVIIEATLTERSPAISGYLSHYKRSLAGSKEFTPDEIEFANNIKAITPDDQVDGSNNMTKYTRDDNLDAKCQLLTSRGAELKQMAEENKWNRDVLKRKMANSVFIFIGSCIPLMVDSVNRTSGIRSATADVSDELFSSYATKVTDEAFRVIDGTKSRIDFLTHNSYGMRNLQSKVMTLGNTAYDGNGNIVHIWQWEKKKGSDDLNSDAFRPGRANQRAIRYQGEYYVRTPESNGDIPEDLLDTPPDDSAVSQYWTTAKLYKVEGNKEIGGDDDGKGRGNDTITAGIHAAEENGDDLINGRVEKDTDSIDYDVVAENMMNSLFADEYKKLTDALQTTTAAAARKSIESKIAKIENFRQAMTHRVKSVREASQLTEDRERRREEFGRMSYAQIKAKADELDKTQKDLLGQMKSLSAKAKELKTTPDSDTDVSLLRDTLDDIKSVSDTYKETQVTMTRLKERMADENVKQINISDNPFVSKQTLHNNMDKIHDDILRQLRDPKTLNKSTDRNSTDKQFNFNRGISPRKYNKFTGAHAFSPEDKEMFAKLATEMETPVDDIVDMARTLKTNPRDKASMRQLIKQLVDADS